MAQLFKVQKRLTIIASVLGIIQSTAWIILTIICIVVYFGSAPEEPSSNASHMSWVQYGFFLFFLDKNSELDEIINPKSFLIFTWLYLFIDLIWLGLSVVQLYCIHKVARNPLTPMQCWIVITAIICFIDLLFVILIGVTFNKICPEPDSNPLNPVACSDIYLPVLVIAARGFILWIVNLVFAFILYKIVKTVKSGKNFNYKLRSVDPQIPRATLQKPTRNGNGQERAQNQWNNPNQNSLSNNSPPGHYNNGNTIPTVY